MCWRALARARPSLVRARISSRSNSARPAEHGHHQAPVRRGGVGPCVAKRTEAGLAVGDRGEDVQQVAGRARQAVEPRHHQHVAGVELVERAAALAAVGLRSARHLAEHRSGHRPPESAGAPGRPRSGRLSRLGRSRKSWERFCNRISGTEKRSSFQRPGSGALILRPRCRLSDARQTIGFIVGPCPLSVIGCGRPDRLKWVVSGPSPRTHQSDQVARIANLPASPRNGKDDVLKPI